MSLRFTSRQHASTPLLLPPRTVVAQFFRNYLDLGVSYFKLLK
jgi:hypothetical protein